MNEKVLKTLEFNKIIEKLASFAGSAMGREKCEALVPVSDREQVEVLQRETADALSRLYKKGTLSFSGLPDIGASIKRLEIGSTLGAGELMKLSSLLTATLRVKNYGANGGDEVQDSLSERFSLLEPLSILNNEIARCIISEEEIADDASPGLKSVRRQIKAANDKIHEQLAKLITDSGTKLMLQDAIVTMRNGRYCLPVKQEYKNSFGGMLHDQSATGSTAFIEPASVVVNRRHSTQKISPLTGQRSRNSILFSRAQSWQSR